MSESGRGIKFVRLCEKHIEELPNEVLAEILSRLNTKEAVRICTVSRRWINLWKLCRNLDLDFSYLSYNVIDVLRCVDHVLHNDLLDVDLDRLRIAFYNVGTGVTVDHIFREWLKFANNKRVRFLDINASNPNFLSGGSSHWAPPKIAMPLTSWDRLVTLFSRAVVLDDFDVDLLLSKSPNLEMLSLKNVPLSTFVLNDTKNPKLKRLEIQQCLLFKCLHVFSAPNLESFKYVPATGLDSCACDVRFIHAPKLGVIDLGITLCGGMLLKLQEYFPQLQKLQLDMFIGCHGCLFRIPTLINLKQLELRSISTTALHDDNHDKMETFTQIVDSCPDLEKLTLKYETQSSSLYDLDHVYDYHPHVYHSHACLRKVVVMGWSGFKYEVQMIRHLIHTSPNREDLILDPIPPHQTETEWYSQIPPELKVKLEFEHAAKVKQQLIGYLRENQRARPPMMMIPPLPLPLPLRALSTITPVHHRPSSVTLLLLLSFILFELNQIGTNKT